MSNVSTFAHADGRVRETAAFLDLTDRRLFTVTTAPADGAPCASVLVMSPIGGDHETNYRREVLLARALAHHGVLTARFHYAGTANSTGDAAGLTLDSMLADARAVVGVLPGGSPGTVVGTRLSALPAALLAAETGAARLVLWDPAPDGRTYFRQLSRTLSARQMTAYSRREAEDDRPLLAQLADDGEAAVAGYSVHAALHDSSQGRALVDVALPAGTAVDIVLFGATRLAAIEPVVARWSADGARVHSTVVDEVEQWWFTPDHVAEEDRPLTRRAVELTRDLVLGTTPEAA